MDENKTPEEILDEIMNRAAAPAQPPEPDSKSPAPLRFESPPPEDSPLPPPPDGAQREAAPERPAALMTGLAVMLGIALLVLGLCVIQLTRINGRLDALEQAADNELAMDKLQRENSMLTKKVDNKQEEIDDLEQQLLDAGDAAQEQKRQQARIKERQEKDECLLYVGRFMDSGDYPMAALVMRFSIMYASDFQDNPVLLEQYLAYHNQLIEKGWLIKSSNDDGSITTISSLLNTRLYPEEDADMAALGILWCCLEAYYVEDSADKAVYYLLNYEQYSLIDGDDHRPFPQRVREFAQADTVGLYQRLIQDLVDDGELKVTEDGTLGPGPNLSYEGELYDLPFKLPPLPDGYWAQVPCGTPDILYG